MRPGFSAAPGSFSQMKQVMPFCGVSASLSVRTSTKTRPERRPLVTHIFWPLISQSPSLVFTPDVLIAATSEPSSGSDSVNAARISPVAIRGRSCCFCSSVPNFISR